MGEVGPGPPYSTRPATGSRLFVSVQDAVRAKRALKIGREAAYWLVVICFCGTIMVFVRAFPQ
jgi:hypothetical protein